ncbi:hypothetical protein ACP4OV_012790 [Aristida adscensionis]
MKKKRQEQQQSPPASSGCGTVAVEKALADESGDGCINREETADAQGTLKQKRKVKKKREEQQQSPPASSVCGTVAVEKVLADESGDGCINREETVDAQDTLKRKRKMKKKRLEQQQSPPASSGGGTVAVEKVLADESGDGCINREETVDAQGTLKRKRKRKKKRQEQQQSPPASSGGGTVAVEKVLADESGDGCINREETADGHISLDSTNGGDTNCSHTKDDDDSMKNKDEKNGMKDCKEHSSLLQEMSVERKRPKKIRRGRGRRKVVANESSPTACVIEAHKEKIKNIMNIYSPRGSLIRFQKKKLLILDLNGLLADINQDYKNAEFADARVRGKLVFRRPYCDDFLRFCFQNFELGVWSSRKRENVNSVVNILMRDLKQYLLFCWDMSHCTVTGCTTVDNKSKPLVLKELKKLWCKEDSLPWEQGEFSASNTLLVDDSPYKALCNPPHTAIFPNPYSYLNQRDDYSLGPGGDLRVYLEKLAQADDVQVFVKDNPFGQPAIAEGDPHWNFYVQIVNKVESSLA